MIIINLPQRRQAADVDSHTLIAVDLRVLRIGHRSPVFYFNVNVDSTSPRNYVYE